MNPVNPSKNNAFDHARTPYPWSFNEYSELRTIPESWTLEEVKDAAQAPKNGNGRHEVQGASISNPDRTPPQPCDEKNNNDDAIIEWHRNRFLESGDTAAYWALTW